jgi:hypothetical protein
MDYILHLGMIEEKTINGSRLATGKSLKEITYIKTVHTLFLAPVNASEKMYLSIVSKQVNYIFIQALVYVIPVCIMQVTDRLGIFKDSYPVTISFNFFSRSVLALVTCASFSPALYYWSRSQQR